MRVVRRMLLAVTGCLAVAFVLAATAAAGRAPAAVQSASYHWVQPWTAAPVAQPWVQPPSWVGSAVVTDVSPTTSYPWVQPWNVSRTGASVQPPSWIPIR